MNSIVKNIIWVKKAITILYIYRPLFFFGVNNLSFKTNPFLHKLRVYRAANFASLAAALYCDSNEHELTDLTAEPGSRIEQKPG